VFSASENSGEAQAGHRRSGGVRLLAGDALDRARPAAVLGVVGRVERLVEWVTRRVVGHDQEHVAVELPGGEVPFVAGLCAASDIARAERSEM
jgi:uncharacterized protein YijF (DUF1287 family)